MTTPLPAPAGARDQDLPPPNPRWVVVMTVVAIVLVAFNLRSPVTSLGSLLSDVRGALGIGAGVAGFLTSAPTLVFGVAGAAVPLVARRAPSGLLVTVSLVVLAAGTALRAAGGVGLLVVGTLVAMLGIAVINILLPVIVRSSFPRRQGWLTGVYVSTLQIGAATASALSVPIASSAGSWRAGLAWWAVPAMVAVVAWLPTSRVVSSAGRRDDTGTNLDWPTLLRDRTAVALAVLFGVQSLAAYVVMGWLPTVLRDAGLSPGRAGTMLAIVMAVMVPMSLLAPAWVATRPDQRVFVPAVAVPWVIGFGGLWLAPTSFTIVWMVMIGAGMTSFPIALLLMGLRSATPGDTREVSAFAQGLGYVIALPGPLLFGVLHDATGGWDVPLLIMLALIVPIAWGGLHAGRDTFIGHDAVAPDTTAGQD
jgi:CP family cyanate transporter-like MFS transporter